MQLFLNDHIVDPIVVLAHLIRDIEEFFFLKDDLKTTIKNCCMYSTPNITYISCRILFSHLHSMVLKIS